MTRSPTKAIVPDSSQPAFSESMFAASKASPERGIGVDGSPNARRQKSTSEDAKALGTVHGGDADASPSTCQQQMAPQVEMPQPELLTIPNVTPMQSPPGDGIGSPDASVLVANGSIRNVTLQGEESNIAQPGTVLPTGPRLRQFQWGRGQGQSESTLSDPRM